MRSAISSAPTIRPPIENAGVRGLSAVACAEALSYLLGAMSGDPPPVFNMAVRGRRENEGDAERTCLKDGA